jgi:histidyl-tRNA synthetase
MRILDCKSPVCSQITGKSPVVTDFLCGECKEHFEGVQALLNVMDIPFAVNPRVVRGLDYYTRTVFEFVSELPKLEGMVLGGGGRYDGLIEELGGPRTPSLGFGLGLERVLLQLRELEAPLPEEERCAVYIASMGEAALEAAAKLACEIRAEGLSAQFDIAGRSLKAQMKYADKLGARFTLVLGEEELQTRRAQLKNMQTGAEEPVGLDDFADAFGQMLIREAQEELQAYFNE